MAARGVRIFAVLGELLQRIGAYRLQQPPPRRCRIDSFAKRLGDEAVELLDDRRIGPAHATDGLGGLESQSRREDGQVTQQALLFRRQQLVAPVERGTQGPVARDRGPAPAGQQREAIAQPGGHLLGADKGGAGRGELDGERDAVEVPDISAIDGRSSGRGEKPESSALARVRTAPWRCSRGCWARPPAREQGRRAPGRGSGSPGSALFRGWSPGPWRAGKAQHRLTRVVTPSIRCSQLSSTIRRCRATMPRASNSSVTRSPPSFRSARRRP